MTKGSHMTEGRCREIRHRWRVFMAVCLGYIAIVATAILVKLEWLIGRFE